MESGCPEFHAEGAEEDAEGAEKSVHQAGFACCPGYFGFASCAIEVAYGGEVGATGGGGGAIG